MIAQPYNTVEVWYKMTEYGAVLSAVQTQRERQTETERDSNWILSVLSTAQGHLRTGERERDRETDRDKDTERQRQRDKETEK